MKKLTTSLIAVAMMLVLSQCKKNEIVKNNNGITPVTAMQQGPDIERILNFNKAVQAHRQNPDLRTRDIVDIEEAADDIADLFNVTYTEPTAYYIATESHQFSINLPLTADGKVLVDDVVAAYEQAVAEARKAYHGSALANKGYRRLMVTFDMQRDGEVSLDFDGQYGSKTDQPQPPTRHIDGPFSEGDDWHYMDGMGSCDGLYPGGADKALQDTIMNEVRALWPIPYDGGRGVFIHLVRKSFFPTESTTHNLFYRNDIENTCIEWIDMNDLLHSERNLIFEVIPLNSIDPVIVLHPTPIHNFKDYVTAVIIQGEKDPNETFIRHNTTVEYGRYLNICIEFNEL